MDKKVCTVCGEEKELSEFYFDKNLNKHASRCKQCRKKYNQQNADKIRDNNKRFRDRNREKIRQQNRESYWRNKALMIFSQAKRNNRGIDFSITRRDVVIPEVCPIFSVPFDRDRFAPSLDRLDNTLGYIPGNVWVISKLANTMKNSATLSELFTFCANFKALLEDDIVQTVRQRTEVEIKSSTLIQNDKC